jgi:glycosyltransferase involved in cell wall biosynthesis
MKQNKFKIIVASYNNEEWVEYNLASILNQTYTNYHVMYVDDCSTDKTNELVNSIVGSNDKFTVIKNEVRVGEEAIYNYVRFYETLEDDEICVSMCGDDWLFDEHVLEKLNNFYNERDPWMTYGEFYAYDGSESVVKANPQNTHYPDLIHEHKLYRRDVWRASHLLTFRGFLAKAINLDDIKSMQSGKWYHHAPDLAVAYPCLEMCPKEKIGVVDFPTYVWNSSPSCQVRTKERESGGSIHQEVEIRNRKHYREGLSGEKLPQINTFGYNEFHHHPTKFTYCYNQEDGEFDMTVLADESVLDYLSGKIKLKRRAPVVARLYEQREYFQNRIFNAIIENYEKFDVVLTYDRELLKLIPNARLMPVTEVTQFNMLPTNPYGYAPYKSTLVDTYNYPAEALKIYDKTKLVSAVVSSKAFLPGHVKRLQFINSIKDRIDLFGRGMGKEIPSKLDALADYMFSIAIENVSCDDNYFTEKIVDCFLTGTIPIYHGCINIGEFFDSRCILYFETEEELSDIINNLSPKKYYEMLEYAKINYEKCFNWPLNNDMGYELYFGDIISKYTK